MSHPNDDHLGDATADYVRSALRDAAEAHRPDRDAMAHRVARGRAATRSTGRRGMYPIAAAFAVAVIVVFSVVVVRSTGDDGNHRGANPPAAAGLPSSAPSSPPVTTAGAATVATRSATTTAPNGFVTAKGGVDANSVATWSQDNLTLTNTRTLAALRVTITVALTPGTADAGRYTTVPNADVTMTVTRGASTLTYSYVLKQGTNLAPGTYIFAAQFEHRSGRTPAKDSYAVAAESRTGGAELSGAFI